MNNEFCATLFLSVLVTFVFHTDFKVKKFYTFLFSVVFGITAFAQYIPKNAGKKLVNHAERWADSVYAKLSPEERLGQLFIVALYTNKDEAHIANVRRLVEKEKIGGIILMQDDAAREIELVNEFQSKSRVPLIVGMDAEWGLYQRIAAAHKFPWAITLGAIQNDKLIYEMAAKIAEDSKRMGVSWNFAPVVDVNTKPANPIIGNRSFGSEVPNVIRKATAYVNGLQDNGVMAAIKHFPGHGDTSVDSHHDLPVIAHDKTRLNAVELAPFRAMANSGVAGIMVAHLYVPALEPLKNTPASISYNVITGVLKNDLRYKGLIITDALNMAAVTKKHKPGELDALAFKAGNDIMLFSDGVQEGKRLIQQAVDKGEISEDRIKESVLKILKTKYLLGLTKQKPMNPKNINNELNNESHRLLTEKLYANAATLLKNENSALPLKKGEQIYYVGLEEATGGTFAKTLGEYVSVIVKKPTEIASIPTGSKVIVGFHKDNSTAYKPYKISAQSKAILNRLRADRRVILDVFGSPYALRDVDIDNVAAVLVSYENNDLSMIASAKALAGQTNISGRLPVTVNQNLQAGAGMDLTTAKTAQP